jgi:hypothetical protein
MPITATSKPPWLFTNLIDAQAQSDTNDLLISQVAAWLLFVDPDHLADLASDIQATNGIYNFVDYVSSPNAVAQLTLRDAVDEALNASQNAVLVGWTPTTSWMVVTGDVGWINANNHGQPVEALLTPIPQPASILSTGTFLLAAWLIFRKNRGA